MTLLEYKKEIEDLLESNPEYGDMTIIYSADDEGNYYQKVNYGPSPAVVENLEDYNLEMVGNLGDKVEVWDGEEEKTEILGKDRINCIIIN